MSKSPVISREDVERYICSLPYMEFVQLAIGAFSCIHNWRVPNGHYPTSQKDAEEIFIELIFNRTNLTATEIENRGFNLPKPSGQYVAKLAQETEKARKAIKNKYFKFNAEDGVTTFKTREFFTIFHAKSLKKSPENTKLRVVLQC